MILQRLNHVAFAVPDLEVACAVYRLQLEAQLSDVVHQEAHGVSTVFIELANTKIELMQPLGSQSPLRSFLAKNPLGGIHHVCYEVENIFAARDHLIRQGARLLGHGEPQKGAQGKWVLFLHPKDFCGALLELEER